MLWFLLITPFIIPFILKPFLRNSLSWQEMGIQGIVCAIAVIVLWQGGKMSQVHDTEIWNGVVQSKDYTDGHYQTSYSCPPCTKSCTGSGSNKSCTETCSTCYEDHYTRDWWAQLSIGRVSFDTIDTTSRSRRDAFQSARWEKCRVGESASLEKSYVNYVQAESVASSIYDTNWEDMAFADQVPAYPRVFDHYRINRVINQAGAPDTYVRAMNDKLNLHLQTVGYKKQANVVVILTNNPDQSFRYTVESKWLGGNKNDIVVFIGMDKQLKFLWADVMTFALNEGNFQLQVDLRESLMMMGGAVDSEANGQAVADLIIDEIVKGYTRPTMEARNHLAGQVAPSTRMMVITWIVMLVLSAILTFVFHKHEVDIIGAIRDAINRRGGRSRSRYSRRFR